MSKTAFIDTNLAIAYVFFINSLHFKSKAAFDEYNWIYCSNSVEKEFKYRFYSYSVTKGYERNVNEQIGRDVLKYIFFGTFTHKRIRN